MRFRSLLLVLCFCACSGTAAPAYVPVDCNHPPPNEGGCDGIEPDAGPPSNPCDDAGDVWQQTLSGSTICAPLGDGGW